MPGESGDRSLQPCVVARWCGSVHADERDTRRFWQQWWSALNVLLVMSNSWAAADEGTDLAALRTAPAFARSVLSPEWDAAAAMALAAVQPLLTELFADGVPAPVVGFELLGDDQRVVAECELAWPGKRIAVTLGVPADEWIAAGWTAFAHDTAGLATQLAALLKS
jgi:DEAD/DEAH box helicase domain-containing protein